MYEIQVRGEFGGLVGNTWRAALDPRQCGETTFASEGAAEQYVAEHLTAEVRDDERERCEFRVVEVRL